MTRFDLSFDKITDQFNPTIDEYKIGLFWGISGACSEKDLPAMIKNCSRTLKEEIYGDFKERLLKLEHHVYRGDHDDAAEEIRSILSEVFD